MSLPDSPASAPKVKVGEPARASGKPNFFLIFECSDYERVCLLVLKLKLVLLKPDKLLPDS